MFTPLPPLVQVQQLGRHQYLPPTLGPLNIYILNEEQIMLAYFGTTDPQRQRELLRLMGNPLGIVQELSPSTIPQSVESSGSTKIPTSL